MKNNNKLEAIIFDLSGTIIDFGSLATLCAMKKVFDEKKIKITNDEINKNMGIKKIDHIKKILEQKKIKKKWIKLYKKKISKTDLNKISYKFDKFLKIEVKKKFNLIPNVKKIFKLLRKNNIKIGATTGYPKKIIKILKPFLKKNNILPDQIICPEDVKKSRPHPDMCLKNILKLGIKDSKACIKIDDSSSGIIEGNKANMYTVGLVFTGIQFGLSNKEYHKKTLNQKRRIRTKIQKIFKKNKANYIVDDLFEFEKLLLTKFLKNFKNI